MNSAEPSRRRWRTWAAAAALAAAAAALRLWNLRQGLPELLHPDEGPVLDAVQRVLASPSLHPRFFIYPALQIYLTAGAAAAAWPLLHAAGLARDWAAFRLDEAALAAVGRALVAAFSLGTIAWTYAVARTLRSPRAGWWAAAFLAVCPYHALSTRYTSVDTPMAFWAMAAVWCAAAYVRRPRPWLLWLGAGFVAAAAATKYLGVLFWLPLACAAFAGRGEAAPRSPARRAALAAGLLAAVVAGFSLLAPYTWIDLPGFLATMRHETRFGYQEQFGWDLAPPGFIYHRYVYQLCASLPFTLGFGVYAMSLWGAAAVWRCGRPARASVLPALAVYFALVGSLSHIFPRYLIPLLPLLCVCAGGGFDAAASSPRARTRRLAWALGLAGAAHAGLMAATMARGLNPLPAFQAAEWIERRLSPYAVVASAHERPLLPHRGRRRWIHLEPRREWLDKVKPDCLVVDGWTLMSLERAGPRRRREREFFASLDAPDSPYRLAAVFDSRYFTEDLYARLDPQFRNQFESACVKLYVRKTPARGPTR